MVLCAAPVSGASSKKPSCKKIRDAVWANKTLDQIMKEFDTDAETVMKCTQKSGKRKASAKAPSAKGEKASKGGSKATKSSGGSAGTKSKSTPSSRKSSMPRSGPWPKHVP
jgi:hypothetical protein